MNKVIQHSYGGMMQDTSKSKFPNEIYYEGRNIRIVATDSQSSGSVTNEKGNLFILQIPHLTINRLLKTITYNTKVLNYTSSEIDALPDSFLDQKIIGHSNSRHYILLFTTDDNGTDCIWKLGYDDYDLTLLYVRNMRFSTSRPIQVINNFENKNIDKIYWVDSLNQLRFINIEHSIANQDYEELIDLPLNSIDMVGKYNLSQPIIMDLSTGGNHTAGMIQYAYNLYNLNASQTKISPLSELVSLDKGILGGGAVNEVVGTTPNIQINNIDPSFTNIRVYAIKYTSFNDIPSISLIDDRQIPSTYSISIYDDGRIISTLSVDDFIFLGSDIVIPKHINSKFNRLFLANYNEINFNVDLDMRAYSFNSGGTSTVYKDVFLDVGDVPNGTPFTITTDSDYDSSSLVKNDSINLNYSTYKYQKNGSTYGGEGKYLKYEIVQSATYNPDARYFKDSEIYRLGIVFFNAYGQTTLPKWIGDFRSRSGNLKGHRQNISLHITGSYNTLKVTLKPAFFTWLSSTSFASEYDKPVGYKILIGNRTLNDRTIIASGLIAPMMVDHKTTTDESSISVSVSDSLPKLPNILTRNVNPSSVPYGNVQPLKAASHLAEMNNGSATSNTEIQRAFFGNLDTAGRLYQYNSMMQLYSPEVLFGNTTLLSPSTKFRIKGAFQNNTNNAWGRVYNHNIDEIVAESKAIDGISPFYSTSSVILNTGNDAFANGLVAHPPSTDAGRVVHNMFYRLYGDVNQSGVYPNTYSENTNTTVYDVYGSPEITEKGQAGTNYNNDPKFRYINSLESVLTDGDTSWADDGQYGRKIISINSYGNRCISFVLGSDDQSTDSSTRPKLETLHSDSSFETSPFFSLSTLNSGLIGEFIKSDSEIYLGNIYGGNSYSDKHRTDYIEIGDYKKLDSLDPVLNIDSPGDTFVRNFRFARIVRTDTTNYNQGIFVLEEIVEFPIETTIDLKNRNDLSLNTWDSKFQPQDAEYHKYNKVYSQMPTLITRRDLGYNIKKISNLDTNVISSKLKHSGELIDSWTDLSPNDTITLDGKHGSINALANLNDELFTLQDKAIAFLSINPRVQVQGGDGLAIQLGTGTVLDRYKYLSTDTGTLNKWSVITSSNGLYFYDSINKGFAMTNGGEVQSISDLKGMHSFFINNTQDDVLKLDNPLLKTGVSGGYDYVNNEVFMTFHQPDNSFTLAFNENKGMFTSLYDYLPSMYISKGQYFITTDPSIKKLYRQYEGEYGKFYEVYYPSSITFNVNPEPNQDCIFDNINFKSEVYLNNVDQSDKTLTSIRAYNDYQDSGNTNLIVGRNGNIRRKFRDWNAFIPRDGRNRIRAPWIKLNLTFNNTNNYKLIMHDTSIYYTIL